MIGAVATMLLLILFSAAGAWVIKHQGTAAMRRTQDSLAAGRMPTTEVIDGFLIVCGGTLMLIPGFFTDFVGLFILLPPIRKFVRGATADALRIRVARKVRIAGSRLGGDESTGPNRAYRRPGDAPPDPARRQGEADVIDVDGEEIILFGRSAELGPSSGK